MTVSIPYVFQNQSGRVPAQELDDNFTALANAIQGNFDVSSIAATTYTLTAADATTIPYLRFTAATAVVVTVPPSSAVTFTVGAVVALEQAGAGALSVTPGSGVTIRTPATLTAAGQYAQMVLVNVGVNIWTLGGNLAT